MAMVDIIDTVRCIVEQEGSIKDRASLLQQLDSIRNRSLDGLLRVAVIGEFNAGKSTFINSLLRYRLLREGIFPTTAAATYLRRGTEKVSVIFSTGMRFDRLDQISDYLLRQYGKSARGRDEVIAAITAEQTIARDVTRIDICVPCIREEDWPSGGLPNNVELIDTPGFNPGAGEVENHYDVTRNVVEEYADLAIVLMPAHAALSATLISFLDQHLRRYIHRCIFVITKADDIEEAEREKVMGMVHDMIESHYGLRSPAIFAVAARTVLPVRHLPAESMHKWNYYRSQFISFESFLWKRLEEARGNAIHASLARLLKPLIEQIRAQIALSQMQISEAKRCIAEHMLERVEDRTNRMLFQQTGSIRFEYEQVKSKLLSIAGISKKNCKNAIVRIIRVGGYLEKFQEEIQPQVTQQIELYCKQFVEQGSTMIDVVSLAYEKIVKGFRDSFTKDYAGMPALDVEGQVCERPMLKFDVQGTSSSMIDMKYLEETSNIEAASVSISIILGAVLVPIPVVGAVVGAYLGSKASTVVSALWRGFTGRSERSVQDDVIQKIHTHIDSVFHELTTKTLSVIDQLCSSRLTAMEKLAQSHISVYGAQVNALRLQCQAQIDQCNAERCRMDNSLHTLMRIDLELQNMIQQ